MRSAFSAQSHYVRPFYYLSPRMTRMKEGRAPRAMYNIWAFGPGLLSILIIVLLFDYVSMRFCDLGGCLAGAFDAGRVLAESVVSSDANYLK